MNAVPLALKLLAAHLLGDYPFQPVRVALGKHRVSMLVLHAAAHGVLLVLVALTEPPDPRLWAALGLLLAAHVGIDAGTSRMAPRDLRLLALDQGLHLAAIACVAALARPAEAAAGASALAALARDPRAWVVVCGAVATVWGGAIVVGRVVEPFTPQLQDERPGLQRAGRLIGLIERTLVFLAMLLRAEALVGFVVAAKALLRLPEAREPRSRLLAEYYLIGTLLSVCWAVVIAVLTRWALDGRP
jgi:hypothetical protein